MNQAGLATINTLKSKLTFGLLLTLILAIIYKDKIFTSFDQTSVADLYSQSQYILGDSAINKIDDATLYQYAGVAYLRGEDPTTINFEHPPLGKYFFGLSTVITGNPLIINLLFFYGILLLLVLLMNKFSVSTPLQYLFITYFAIFSSLKNHLFTSLLDLQTLFLSLLYFVLLFSNKESWAKYLAIGLTLGLFISTKYFFPIIFLYLLTLFIWSFKKKTLIKASVASLLMLVIYLLGYVVFFTNHNLVDFIKFEWYRFKWWTGNRTIPKFIILNTLFTGQYPAWWEKSGTMMRDGDWNISWPVLFVSYLISLFKQKYDLKKTIVLIFSLALMIIFLFGSAVYGRYLLQLIPFWLISLAGIKYAKKSN
ncbi:MAG: hypothetical protein IT416_02575 [Candidatus Pacebacteria bacterium]|nr:hypothetical protein [Candidatus Paceibacterota bacterium]